MKNLGLHTRRRGRVFVLVSAFVVLVLLHSIGWLRPIEDGVRFVLQPVLRVSHNAAQSVFEAFHFFGSIGNLASENGSLKKQVEQLQSESAQLQEVQRENAALRSQLKFSQKQSFTLEPTFVIGYDPTSFTEYLTLDKGSESKIAVNNPVITDSGILIGRVAEVGWKTSKVLLVTDSTSSVSTTIQDSRATGLVHGDHGLGLVMELIPQDEVVKSGDRVVTSGLGGTFPKGLALGEVESVSQSANELFQTARIKPYTSLHDVEIAFVITSF